MHFRNGLLAVAFAGYTIVVAHVSAQGAPQTPPPAGGAPQGTQPAPAGRGQGRGGGRGQATFPAQQRAPGDPVLIERGKGIYTISCSSCHGVDLRGGVTGGPNLLRSAVVLNDQSGELILPIVRGARAERGMLPLPISDDDVKAVAEYIHSILATARNQGAPPATDTPPPNALVGNATAGQAYFNAKCSACHQPGGDLQGIGSRFPEAKALQNAWVAGGGGGGRGGGRGAAAAAAPNRRLVTVTVTQPSGEKAHGRLVRIDSFIVTLEESDGSIRSFRRDGDRPKVEINDPMAGHRALLLVLTNKDMHDVTAYLATLK